MRKLFSFAALAFAPLGLVTALETGGLDRLIALIPAEPLVRAELEAGLAPGELDSRIEAAFEQDDLGDVQIYVEIADWLGHDLSPAIRARLAESRTVARRLARNTSSFLDGFVTGTGLDPAGFAGALASDLTVIGDLRDIAGEGSKLVAGKPYSELVLGLSVGGVALTAATMATGGTALPARTGVSLLKLANRSGMVTRPFADELGRVVVRAIDTPRLRRVLDEMSLADIAGSRRRIEAYAASLRGAGLVPVLTRVGEISRHTASPVEAVRLMKHVGSVRDLEDVAGMAAKLGAKTRGVIRLTGKTSLRAFKTAFNLARWLIEWIWAAGAALASWALHRLWRSGWRRLAQRAARPDVALPA